jgi:hypothetical protein
MSIRQHPFRSAALAGAAVLVLPHTYGQCPPNHLCRLERAIMPDEKPHETPDPARSQVRTVVITSATSSLPKLAAFPIVRW